MCPAIILRVAMPTSGNTHAVYPDLAFYPPNLYRPGAEWARTWPSIRRSGADAASSSTMHAIMSGLCKKQGLVLTNTKTAAGYRNVPRLLYA